MMRLFLTTLLTILFTWNIAYSQVLPTTSYKYKNTLKVYNNLKFVAPHDVVEKMPELIVSTEKKRVAAYIEDSNQIVIEEVLYDLCTQYFGKDSLAALSIIMGHELSHCIKGHHSSGFTCSHFDAVPYSDQSTQQEKEADIWGMFTSYQVGYDIQDIAPKVFEKVYQVYNLDAKQYGYPHLAERKKLVNSSLQKLKDLTQLFEAATYLMAIRDYTNAYYTYQLILKDYQSADILSNAGICCALAAIDMSDNRAFPFAYPFEVNTNSRLYRLRELPYGLDPEQERKKFLKKALQYFEQAIQFDSQNVTYQVHLASVLDLQGRTNDAVIYINRLKKQYPNSMSIKLLEGIQFAQRENSSQARKWFSNNEHPLASYNLKILDGQIPSKTIQQSQVSSEKISGVSLQLPPMNYDVTLNLQRQQRRFFKYKKMDRQKTSLFLAGQRVQRTYIHLTKNSRNKNKDGIGVGSAKSKLKNYGEDYHILAVSTGTIRIYPQLGMLFKINHSQKISEWGVYKVN